MNLNDIFVQDRNGQIICKKFGDHNDPVILVVMQEQLPTQDKLLCKKCNDAKIQVCPTLSFVQAQEAMKEKVKAKKDEDEEFRKRSLNILSQFLVQIKSLQSKINKHIESIETQTKEWKKFLEKYKGEEIKINFIEDILLLHRNIPKLNKNQENMTRLNKSHFGKIDLTLKKLSAQEEIQVCFNTLRNVYGEQQVQQFVQPEQFDIEPPQEEASNVVQFSQQSTQILTQIQVKCVNTQESKEWLAAIAFNFTGTTMASVSGENINIWKFYKGKMGPDKVLEGHTNYINCLLFSKYKNWLASAGDDNTIRLWKRSEEGEGEWISSQPSKGHEKSINCIIWCKQEEQLISCGEDQYIIVWQVKYENKEIQKFQNLEKKHTDRILGIDINDNETALVSCSQDKSIILWNKAANGQWQFKNKFESDDYGCRICFISENLIARQQHSQGITDIFEIINGVINYSSNLILNETKEDHYFFPTIKNEKNNIFIQSHNRFVYILRREGKSFKQATNYIDCNDKFNYGAMTLEGDYLAIWNYETRQIMVYNVIYN